MWVLTFIYNVNIKGQIYYSQCTSNGSNSTLINKNRKHGAPARKLRPEHVLTQFSLSIDSRLKIIYLNIYILGPHIFIEIQSRINKIKMEDNHMRILLKKY